MPHSIRFPFPSLRIGTDICQVSHIHRILADPHRGTRFIRRVLTPEERDAAREPIADILRAADRVAERKSASLKEHEVAQAVTKHEEPQGAEEARGVTVKEEKRSEKPWVKPTILKEAAIFMAGRFAAKEAVIKAHPHLCMGYRHIVIKNETYAWRPSNNSRPASGPPTALVKTSEILGEDHQDQEAILSISHDGDYATAVCMGFNQEKKEYSN